MSDIVLSQPAAMQPAQARPAPADMLDLLRQAVDKGLGVEGLERLVALHERFLERGAAEEFASAMAEFQRRCPPIAKTSTARITTSNGGTFTYAYAELDEIARTVNPILASLGLSYSWDSVVEAASLSCTCTLRHVGGYKQTAAFSCAIDGGARMSKPQQHKSALTYAQRCSLISVLGITTADPDDDGQDHHDAGDTISESQIANLQALASEVGADVEKFCKFLKVKQLAELHAADFARAVSALEAKRKTTTR